MERRDNYAIQTRQAQERFLTYDHQALCRKLGLAMDENYLYPRFIGQDYRLSRYTGSLERSTGSGWEDANTFSQVMTLLDLICDSSPSRSLSGRWKNMLSFGQQFHRSLLENSVDPTAEFFAADPEGFAAACRSLGGTPLLQGDVAYAIEIFDGLRFGIQLWLGDEEFPSRLKYMWDENALQYLRYETMHFARGLLVDMLKKRMFSRQP